MTLPTWRGVAARVDLLRSTGPRHAWRRYRQDRALRPLLESRGATVVRALWTDAARELGATVTEVGPARFEIRCGDSTVRVAGQTVELNDAAAVARAADKPAAYELLAAAALPVPEHVVFQAADARPAADFLARGPKPCVVKPARGSGGDGVCGGIRGVGDLRRAVLAASRFAPRLLVERQVPGDVFRLLVLDGRVLDVVRRLRPRVVGDGSSTVEELVLAEYDRRLRGDGDGSLKPFAVDLDCLLALRGAGLSLRSVPAAGEVVEVKTVTNYNRPEENEPLGTQVADELAAEAARAASALDLRLAGVDIVARSAAAGLGAAGGAIVDVNPIPALHHHSRVAGGGGATLVAVPILRALLDSSP